MDYIAMKETTFTTTKYPGMEGGEVTMRIEDILTRGLESIFDLDTSSNRVPGTSTSTMADKSLIWNSLDPVVHGKDKDSVVISNKIKLDLFGSKIDLDSDELDYDAVFPLTPRYKNYSRTDQQTRHRDRAAQIKKEDEMDKRLQDEAARVFTAEDFNEVIKNG